VVFSRCDVIRHHLCLGCRGRIVRRKDQEIPHHNAHADSRAKTSETPHKESFADSISQPEAKGEVQTQESLSDSYTDGISFTNRDSVPHSRRNSDTFALRPRSREKGRAQRYAFA